MEKKVLADAYAALGRKKLTECELLEKLAKKGHEPEAIEPWLDDLRALGYLNDDEVIASEVRRGKLQGHGPIRIAMRLSKRLGVDFGEALERLLVLYSDEEQIAVARKVLEKKKPPREKLYQTLYGRGFGEVALQHFLSQDITN